MTKQLIIFIKNIFKLIGIMYISISLKNVAQILLGTISNYSAVAKPYRLINLNKEPTLELKKGLIELIFLYDFVLFAFFIYCWMYLFLYSIIAKFGNKLWIHISFTAIIYTVVISYFDPFHYNILFYLIAIVLGYLNWWLFEKWIKFE